MQRIDNINCFTKGFAAALEPIATLVGLKKTEVEIYDAAINKLLNISNRLEREGIELEPEQNQKLDALPQYLLHREHAAASLAAFEAFHHVVKGESHTAGNDSADAQKEYSAAIGRLLALPREKWSLQLRSSQTEIPPHSAWTANRPDVKVLDVRKLLDVAIVREGETRKGREREIESGFAEFHNFFTFLLSDLKEVTPSNDEEVSDADALRYIAFVKDMAASLDEGNHLQETREGIAYLKQSIARLEAVGDVFDDDGIRDEASGIKPFYESEVLTMASTVLWAQHIHLLHAQLSFALSPEAVAVLDQAQDKLDDLVMKHPHMLDKETVFVDLSELSQEEKEQMYSGLSIIPDLDNEAASQLRYLAKNLASETVTEDSKDLPLLVSRLSDLAGDLEEAASLVEVMLGELILAGVSPKGGAASEGASEEWHLQRTYGDDGDKASATPHSGGPASPLEPGSKRSSLIIRSRANSLMDPRRFSLQSLERQSQNEIEKAKAYSKPIEANMALLARQAASNKRDAENVLNNLRNGIVDSRNPSNTIYELLNLAVDRNQDRLRGLRKMTARWEKIDDPTDEVRDRIADLHLQTGECEKEIRALKEEAVLKTVEGIELYPTEQGVVFLHRHGLIERMERPLWVKLSVFVHDPETGQLVPYMPDGTPKVDYIHEWPIRARRAPDTDQIFIIYGHDHKKQDTEHPHPETLKESRKVTWKNRYFREKGKLWEQRMLVQGWSPQAATVQRSTSGQRVLNALARHYIKDEKDRIPVEKRLRRFGRQEPGAA